MRIAFVGDIHPTKINGISNSVTNLAAALIDEGHVADLFSTAALQGPVSKLRSFYIEPVRALVPANYDVVVLAGCFSPTLWLAAAKCKLSDVPYVISPRSSLMKASWKRSLWKKILAFPVLYGFLFRGRAVIHFLSSEERENSWSMGQRNFFVVPNVQVSASTEVSASSAKRNVIGYLGRFDLFHKGLDILIAAIVLTQDRIRESGYRVELVGPDHRNGLSYIVGVVHRQNIQDIVAILPPKRDHDKHQWLRSIKIFIHASRYEGQPQAVFEAILEGAFPVVTDGCNMNEAIKVLGRGTHAPDTSSGVADALLKAISEVERNNEIDLSSFKSSYQPRTVAVEFSRHLAALI